jgi:2-aminoadipate transaminase
MLDALAEFFPREAEWTQPGGGLFIWATLPDFIDTGDLLAKALREERVAFVPGSAAYVDGRGGSSMRLNFSGADVDGIVEGVRRIGKVVDEQISLFSTFAGKERRPTDAPPSFPEDTTPLADVVELPRRAGERRAQGS